MVKTLAKSCLISYIYTLTNLLQKNKINNVLKIEKSKSMSIPQIALSQVVIMFLLIGVGFICFKIRMINEETAAQLSEILLMIVTPAVIIKAFQIEFKPELAQGLLLSLILAVISHIVGIIISVIMVKKQPTGKEYSVERFATVYGNSSFMGIPLIAAVLPGNGVFFASAFIAVFNLFIWTHGVTLMTGKLTAKDLLKVIKSPPIIGVLSGLFFFLFSIELPNVIGSAVGFIADLNTPLAMIVTGIYIAKSNLLSAFVDLKIYKVALARLIIIPVIIVGMYVFIRVTPERETVLIANLLASCCPTAATTLLIATKFRAGPEHASKIIAATTIFSVATIPIIMLLFNHFAGTIPVI